MYIEVLVRTGLKSQWQSFFGTLYSCGTHFFSLLMDGTTDCGNHEDELMVLVYCFTNDAVEEITPPS